MAEEQVHKEKGEQLYRCDSCGREANVSWGAGYPLHEVPTCCGADMTVVE